ncbi:unnamed protein product, partial [Allacma fusca]
EFIEREDQDQV